MNESRERDAVPAAGYDDVRWVPIEVVDRIGTVAEAAFRLARLRSLRPEPEVEVHARDRWLV
jgi:hypothetical protein